METMKKYRVAVTDARHGSYEIERSVLESRGYDLDVLECLTEEDVILACAEYDGLLVDMAPMTARVIQSLSQCKIIVRYGVGYDNVDVEACTKKSILVSNVPDYCMEDVSEMAIALMFSCLRRTAMKDRLIRSGQWNINASHMHRVGGKTLALIGFGRIAQAVNYKLKNFHLGRVVTYDPYIPDEVAEKAGVEKVSLEEAFRSGDIISLHMPVTDETRHMISTNAISLMKPSAILINTSRGALVDDIALIEALKNDMIGGAGLDTHNSEPLSSDSPFINLDNCVLTDHSAFNTIEGVAELKQKVAESAATVLDGGLPRFSVNTLS
jgi:D-3-phosphoglycerate dehydrogenase